MVNIDVPAGAGAPPFNTPPLFNYVKLHVCPYICLYYNNIALQLGGSQNV